MYKKTVYNKEKERKSKKVKKCKKSIDFKEIR